MKTILITGGAGFIGSNYVKSRVADKNCRVVVIDALTYAGNLHNLDDVAEDIIFIEGSIADKSLIAHLFDKYDFKEVVNFAAESHVDRSIKDPSIFIKTNVLGTQVLLDVCRSKWSVDVDNYNCRDYLPNVKYLQISTDEVYGTLGMEGKFTESSPISPNSPYSASKAGADLCVRAYYKTYGMPCLITRCSNNYGPNQFPEKLIPMVIKNALSGKDIPVYGNGLQVRDWIYVWDHCNGVSEVLNRGQAGEVYNIGCGNEWKNIDIIKYILNELDKSDDLIKYVKDRPGHDTRYAIDNSKMISKLNWKPVYSFEKGIKLTIDWYLNNETWMTDIISGKYLGYRFK